MFIIQLVLNRNQAYVVYKNANISDNEIKIFDENGEFCNGIDRTTFEAVENHIHITSRVTKRNFDCLCNQGNLLGELMLAKLKYDFPDKCFYVFVTIEIGESMIVRFHQKWDNELPYIDKNADYGNKCRVLTFFG